MNDTPISSGNAFIDTLFHFCVQFLMGLANLFGVSYNTINIVIFCVVWPILTVLLFTVVIRQRQMIRKMKQACDPHGNRAAAL